MILPRSHTWMHLLPAGADFSCCQCPDWLAHPLPPRRDKGVPVLACCSADRITGDAWQGVVALNPHKKTADHLRRSGFQYVQRFAVVPDFQQARWFIPLTGPAAVSAAAFWLYTPFRTSARLKLLAAQSAIHAHLPIWYHDQICIALRNPPPIHRQLQSLFPDREIHLALSSGAPGPDARRKPSLAVIASDGSRLAFVKIAGSSIAAQLIAHEQTVLQAIHCMPGLAHAAPKLLFAGQVEKTLILVQTPISGRRVGPKLTPAHHRFLQRLRTGHVTTAFATQMFATLRQQCATLRFNSLDLLGILQELSPTLAELTIPATITHTDFVPWNLRRMNGEIAAFDWDTAELDGLPLFDLMHHQIMVGYCIENWSPQRARDELLAIASNTALMRPAQAHVIAAVYLIHSIVRMIVQGHDQDHEMVQWYAQILHWILTHLRNHVRATSHRATTSVG